MTQVKRVVIAIGVGLVLCSMISARIQSDPDRQKEFENLIARVKQSDQSIDFGRLRSLYTQLDSYSPYGSSDTKDEMYTALNKGDYKRSLKLASKSLQSNYLDIDAHLVAMVASDKLGDTSASDHHKYVAKGIIDSIVSSGDGTSPATAMKVISVAEEYALLKVYGLQNRSQSLDHIDGHSFDVLTVVDLDTKKERTIYFNIDPIWAAEEKLFGK